MNYPLVIRIWYWILALFCFFFATPYLGLVVMDYIANLIGDCSFMGRGCFVGHIDLGSRFDPYGIMFINLLLTPISFLIAFWDVLIFWFFMLMIFKTLKDKNEKQENDNQVS